MKKRSRSHELIRRFRSTCGWCGRTIPPDTEVLGGGAKARPEVDLSDKRGQVLPIYLDRLKREVLVAVAAVDSEAARNGWDLAFMVCSEECGLQLKTAIDHEVELGDQLKKQNEKREPPDKVPEQRAAFIAAESEDDLIVSFAIGGAESLDVVKTLTLLRTPKFEYILDEKERGVSVDHEDFPEDGRELVESIEFGRSTTIESRLRSYHLNLSEVQIDEMQEAARILRKMNLDERFKLRIM